MEQDKIARPEEVEEKLNKLKNGLEKEIELDQDLARDVLSAMVECADFLDSNEFKKEIDKLRVVLEELGYKDEDTDGDTPSAIASVWADRLRRLAKIGVGCLNIYRTVDAFSRLPDNVEKVKSPDSTNSG